MSLSPQGLLGSMSRQKQGFYFCAVVSESAALVPGLILKN